MMLMPALMACSVPVVDAPVIEPGVGQVGTQPGAAESYPEFGRTAGKDCQERGLGRFLGQRGTPALVAEARDASNSASVRVIRPRELVSADRRANRLNLTMDAAGNVVGARCF